MALTDYCLHEKSDAARIAALKAAILLRTKPQQAVLRRAVEARENLRVVSNLDDTTFYHLFTRASLSEGDCPDLPLLGDQKALFITAAKAHEAARVALLRAGKVVLKTEGIPVFDMTQEAKRPVNLLPASAIAADIVVAVEKQATTAVQRELARIMAPMQYEGRGAA